MLNQIPLRTPIKTVRELGLHMIICHGLIQILSHLHSILQGCFLWRPVWHVGLRLLAALNMALLQTVRNRFNIQDMAQILPQVQDR